MITDTPMTDALDATIQDAVSTTQSYQKMLTHARKLERALKIKPADVSDMMLALDRIATRIPVKPFPDPEAHSWRAYAIAVNSAYIECVNVARRVLRELVVEEVPSGEGKNIGHGHVYPRPDGVLARCGGPGICVECSRDAAQKALKKGGDT